jgi:hypothetical protein
LTVRSANVFINCPFDEDYKNCFEALIFTIAACGYQVRCALEENNSGNIRFDKLCLLIDSSDKSVHDLSRVELNPLGFPRFNMPFELGLCFGAKRFGGKKHRAKSALVMVREPFKLPIYLSDVAGSDPDAHHDQPDEVIRLVRRFLHRRPDGSQIPSATHILSEFNRFKNELPVMATALKIAVDEVDPFRDYRDYLGLLAEFLEQA